MGVFKRLLLVLAVVGLVPLVGSSRVSAVATTSALKAVPATRAFDSAVNGRLSANGVVSIGIVGMGQVPTGASAAVLNVIASSPAADGGIKFYASGSPSPLQTSVTLPAKGSSVVQTLTVPIGADGRISASSSAAVDMAVDIVGYYSPISSTKVGRLRLLNETKVLDRSVTPVPVNGNVEITIPTGVARDAEAVVMTVSVSGALANGSWWLSSQGVSSPIVSGRIGQSASNTVIARPTGGVLRLTTDAGGFVVVTVSGWFTGRSASTGSDGLFVAQSPMRLVDTTSAMDPLGVGVALHTNWTLEAAVLGVAGVPTTGVGALAVVMGTTNSHGPGGTTIYPAGQPRPDVRHVSAAKPGTRASTSLPVAIGDRGLAVHSASGGDVTVDVIGWYTGSAKVATVAKPINVMPTPDVFPGLLWVPDLKLFTTVREDTSWVNFDPSHLPESRSPNQPGNVAIFGHRTSHGREFRNLDRLKVGSLIVLAVGGKIYWYSTSSVEVLSPEDPLLYSSSTNDQTLTLVACHPPGSVKFRIVARASLVSVTSV